MNTAKILPFRFESHEVRTLLIDDQPWFVGSDVASALAYRMASDMTRNLDDDETGTQIVRTPSGDQEMTVINESGLYSAILRSRKAEARRFKKWVTSEVLPAIRKHGHYQDTNNTLGTLIGKTIGTDGFHVLGSLVAGKVRTLPSGVQRSAKMKIWSQLHAAYGVRSAEDIPADQMDGARQFVAAYAIEGEYLPKTERLPVPPLNLKYHDIYNGKKWLNHKDMHTDCWQIQAVGFLCALEQYAGQTVPINVTGVEVLKREVLSLMSLVELQAGRLNEIRRLTGFSEPFYSH